jgi:hypothetical protein
MERRRFDARRDFEELRAKGNVLRVQGRISR